MRICVPIDTATPMGATTNSSLPNLALCYEATAVSSHSHFFTSRRTDGGTYEGSDEESVELEDGNDDIQDPRDDIQYLQFRRS